MTTVRSAVVKALEAARSSDRWQPWHEPSAAIALKVAAAMSRKDVGSADLIRMSQELRKLLDELPLREPAGPDGGAEGDGADPAAGGSGPGDPRSPGLASGVGAGPEMGDTALPR